MKLTQKIFQKLTRCLLHESPKEKWRSYLCDFDRICHEVIPADVLLIEGRNRVSRLIKKVTHSPWTHAALYIGRIHSIEDEKMRELVQKFYKGPPEKQLLLETLLGQGTIIRPIDFYKNHHIRICRPTGLSFADAQKIIGYAIKHLGYSYNTRQFIDLGRFLLPWRWLLPKRWRSTLFTESPTKIEKDVCSTLIAEAFESVKFPILPLVRETSSKHLEMIPRNPKLYTPSDFDYSPYFSIIKYPIFPTQSYENFPWRTELMSHDSDIVTSRKKDNQANRKESK